MLRNNTGDNKKTNTGTIINNPNHCNYIPESVSNRPDPCIYSQFLLMQLDQPVTWDNPDVEIFLDGELQNTFDLRTNTQYDIKISIHNTSREKEAINTKIKIEWLEFGIGVIQHNAIDEIYADIPTWGTTKIIETKWTTPSESGHYCIAVELFHPNDANPANNLGWNNTQVLEANSPVKTQVRIHNPYYNNDLRISKNHPSLESKPVNKLSYNKYDVHNNSKELSRLNYLVTIKADSYIYDNNTFANPDPKSLFSPRNSKIPITITPNKFYFKDDEEYKDVEVHIDFPNIGKDVFNITSKIGEMPLGGVSITVVGCGNK